MPPPAPPVALPPIRRALIQELLRQLGIASTAIERAIKSATSADVARRLRTQRAEIQRVMAVFRSAATGAAHDALDTAWAAGAAATLQQVGESGLAPRISTVQLTATRVLMTGLLEDVSTKAVKAIDTAITQHLLGVRGLSETVTEIQRLMDGAPRHRAMTIAYTEVGRVYSAAQYETMLQHAKRIPALKKAWLHNHKRLPRPGHVLAAKQPPIPVAQPFEIIDLKTGEVEMLRFPRDPNASARNTINCGCEMYAVLPENPDDIFKSPAVSAPSATPPPITPTAIVDKLAQQVAAAGDTGGTALLRRLWTDLASYGRHVDRRMRKSGVPSAAELARRTLSALADPRRPVWISGPGDNSAWHIAQILSRDGRWAVLVNDEGRIVTSYPIDNRFSGFAQRAEERGLTIEQRYLDAASRRRLAELFGAR